MSVQVSGQEGTGQTVLYELGAGESALVETVHFTVATDATAGVHMVRLLLNIPTVGTVARLDDLNAGGPNQTNFYTYGLGLNASACTLPDGLAVTDALPWTELPPGARITVKPIDDTGAEIAGDAIRDVLIQFPDNTVHVPPPMTLPLVLLPGSHEPVTV